MVFQRPLGLVIKDLDPLGRIWPQEPEQRENGKRGENFIQVSAPFAPRVSFATSIPFFTQNIIKLYPHVSATFSPWLQLFTSEQPITPWLNFALHFSTSIHSVTQNTIKFPPFSSHVPPKWRSKYPLERLQTTTASQFRPFSLPEQKQI